MTDVTGRTEGDQLDRIEERSRMSLERGLGERVLITADEGLALVAVARAARELHRETAVGLAQGTRWLEIPEDRSEALGAALARLEEPR